jgi:hypothetical protein
MSVNIYGRSKKKVSTDGLLALSEVTFACSPAELRRVSAFIAKCADAIEKHGNKFGHSHLSDEKDLSPWNVDSVDVIVVRPQTFGLQTEAD